jgi:hypothetical protein
MTTATTVITIRLFSKTPESVVSVAKLYPNGRVVGYFAEPMIHPSFQTVLDPAAVEKLTRDLGSVPIYNAQEHKHPAVGFEIDTYTDDIDHLYRCIDASVANMFPDLLSTVLTWFHEWKDIAHY